MGAAIPISPLHARQTLRLPLEVELLCLCAQAQSSPETKERIRELLADPSLDWDHLLHQAEWHGMAPLLTANLSQLGFKIPSGAQGRLTQLCRGIAHQSLLLTAELLHVLGALKNVGITAVPYKGPLLAALVYGDAALRRSGDLDLLLSSENLEHAKEVLHQLGYAPCLRFSPKQESRYMSAQGALDYVNPEYNISLDLHFELAPRHFAIAMPLRPMLARASEIPFAGAVVSMLQPEDLVLALCVHGSKHAWERLGWICDLAQTLSTYPRLDWGLMRHRAEAAGIRRILLLGLALAMDLLRAEVPADVAALCQADSALSGLTAQVADRLRRGGVASVADGQRWLFLLRARERYRDRALAMLRYAFAPTFEEFSVSSSSRVLHPFLWAVRPLRVARKIIRSHFIPTQERANIRTA